MVDGNAQSDHGQGHGVKYSPPQETGQDPVSAEPAKPEFVPGELIVKLKEGKTLDDIADLSAKYKVSGSEQVFPDVTPPEEVLKELKAKYAKLGTEHNSWYWQLDKDSQEYKDYIAKIEAEKKQLEGQIQTQEELVAHLEQRQKRAPEGLESPTLDNIYNLKTTQDTDILSMAQEYSTNPSVEYAEPNYKVKVQYFPEDLPNDTYLDPYGTDSQWSKGAWGQSYEDLWGLKMIQADKVWLISQGEGVIVAVVDTGVDYTHEDIRTNLWQDGNGLYGFDFVNNDSDPMDDNGHGTHVAGTIAAVGNNGIGIIGVAPKAKVMAVKGLNNEGEGYFSVLSNCIRYAVDNGADVINNSWGGYLRSSLMKETVFYGYSKGCLILTAAGNVFGDTSDFCPANLPGVITVSAIDSNKKRCIFSNWGYNVDIAAPGENILSLRARNTDMYENGKHIIQEKYYFASGTSMACPHVSGLAALIIAKHPDFTNAEVRSIIRLSADDARTPAKYDIPMPGFDALTGYGIINSVKALDYGYPVQANIENVITKDKKAYIYGELYGNNFDHYTITLAKPGGLEDNYIQFDKLFPINYPAGSVTLSNSGRIEIKNNDGIIGTDDDLLGVYDMKDIPNGLYQFCLNVFYRDNTSKTIYSLIYVVDNRLVTGFPLTLDGPVISSPIVADLDKDNKDEIILTAGKKIYVLDEHGIPKIGWPVSVEDDTVALASAAVADLDNDANHSLEIVVRTVSSVYVFDCKGQLLPGWPVALFIPLSDTGFLRSLVLSSPVIAELDGYGPPEIVVTTAIPDSGEGLYVLEADGSLMPGWPQKFGGSDMALISSTPAVGDIDQDGENEIVVKETLNRQSGRKIYVFEHDGTLVWSKEIGAQKDNWESASAPVLADLDNDGYLEIIAADLVAVPPFIPYLKIWRYDGTEYSSVNFGEDSAGCYPLGISLADINHDNKLEIVVPVDQRHYAANGGGFLQHGESKYCLFIFANDGKIIGKKIEHYLSSYSPASLIANTNNNKNYELIMVKGNRYVYFYDNAMTAVQGLIPYVGVYGNNFCSANTVGVRLDDTMISAPAIGDIDGDGLLEVIVGTAEGRIFAWNMEGEAKEENIPWPMYQRNPQHLGCYGSPDRIPPRTIASGIPPNPTSQPVTITLRVNADISGIDKTYYSLDGREPAREYSGPIQISQEGIYTLKYYSIDRVGNKEVVQVAGQITIDRTPPLGSISINNGANETITPNVTLNLFASDSGSGVVQMQFSNDSIHYSRLQPYSLNRAWTLMGGAGQRTVYVKFKDAAGNWSGPISDNIILKPSSPLLIISSPSSSTVSSQGFSLTGMAIGPSPITAIHVSIYDTGRRSYTLKNAPASFEPDSNEWALYVQASKISAGRQARITVSATDAQGKRVTATKYVKVVSTTKIGRNKLLFSLPAAAFRHR